MCSDSGKKVQEKHHPTASPTVGDNKIVSDAKTPNEADITRTANEPIDMPMMLTRLAKLEDRLEILSKSLNEEIQLFIASISIRDSEVMMKDSRIMREDSQIMKQQAARTTLLITLAVIYLPLQLITGIFGMNIREINDGAPRWWACLTALGVGDGLTFLVHLGVKWWQWWDDQQRKRDEQGKKEA